MGIDILDYMGALAGLLGAILVGNKNRHGFKLLAIQNIMYLGYGSIVGIYGLAVLNGLFLIINGYYYRKWTKEELDKKES